MQQVVDDKLRIAVPFLGGVNELVEVFDLPNEEFKSSTGVFPQFNGMVARCPGKVAIRYETSPIRSIHQSFSGGSFCFYVESDRLLLYNECENPRYTVKPETPTDLGTDEDGFTLDLFGGKGNVPLNPPNLSFSPKCVPQGDAPDPNEDPIQANSYLLKTEFFNFSPAVVNFGFDHGAGIDSTYQFQEGVDFTVGPGQTFDFSAIVEAEKANLDSIKISEDAQNTPLSVVTTTPSGAVTISGGNKMVLSGLNTWSGSVATVQVEAVPGFQYSVDTTNFVEDADTIGFQIDVLNEFQNGLGLFIPIEDFDVGDIVDFTDWVLDNQSIFGGTLTYIRFTRILNIPPVFIDTPMEILSQDPDLNFEIETGVPNSIIRVGPTDWPNIVQLQVGFAP